MIGWPQWIKKVVVEGTGRDPLGLSRMSDWLTDSLLPGVITTTDRARYYSYYPWAIADIERERGRGDRSVDFEAEFQRREAAFALASALEHVTDLPIVGVRRINVLIAGEDNEGRLQTLSRVLPSNPTGGFGQYYSGCLQLLGLVTVDENGEWVVASDVGKELVAAFEETCKSALYLMDGWRKHDRVPMDVLRKSAASFSLDAIGEDFAANERNLLIDLFVERETKLSGTSPHYRQATIGLFLHVLTQYEESGSTVNRREVDRDAIFWPHYFGALANDDGTLIPYEPAAPLAGCRMYWEQWCAHQFVVIALEILFEGVLQGLAKNPEGMTKGELLDALVTSDFESDLKRLTGASCNDYQALCHSLGIDGIPDEKTSQAAAKRFHAEAKLNEWTLWCDDEDNPFRPLARSIVMMTILYARWRGRVREHAFASLAELVKDVWLGSILLWMEDWQKKHLSWRDIVSLLIEWLSRQHDTVKFQKHKLDASWFEYANGRFRHQQDVGPHPRASRHPNIATILQDLLLIEHSVIDEPLKLTARGRQELGAIINSRS